MQSGANLTYSYASEEDDDTAFGDAAITPAPAPSGTVETTVEQLQESLFGARVQKAPSGSPRDAYISLDEWENGQHDVPLLSAGVEGGGIAVHVEALSYAIQTRDRSRKLLLHDISFEARPGEMVAVMGASGAGKSTLLDLIAGRKQEGFVAGTIAFNGELLTNQILRCSAYIEQNIVLLAAFTYCIRRCSAYVEQNDVHLAAFTVRETLHFAAQLRLPESLSAQQRHARVGQIAAMLGLQECMDSVVGDALTRGISGGQMKRLSIGTEIIAVPPLLFLDEPTSGLDSAVSLGIAASLRRLAPRLSTTCLDSAASLGIATSLRRLATAQHHTIMATIHQPSPEVFSQFDKVLLLLGGREVYFGPVAHCHKYFSSLPLGKHG
ncbi:P-loop containing nucleoside triphosphate hydrolase protein [Tribonema minus]|uniref:P-loop containing nucleoside triphosphate hydrolase protein n=1 Tax=Tribonema minus TaxID=303371 RepID=A0A836CJG7_9STRA|nr:P-loop containing nucleoside triphosphate hydrolase protein [Tribonema minus]